MRYAPAIALLLISAPLFADNPIGNPGFEPAAGPPAAGLAAGWRDNTWGDTKSTYGLDETNPHSGQTSQRIAGVRGANGACQFLCPLKLEAKKRYHVQLWVRAEGSVPSVGVCLRQGPEPYRHYLASQIAPTREWQLLDFAGFVPSADDTAGLYIWFEPQTTGTVWVDDALVEIVEPTAVLGPAPTGNVIPNASFELDTARTWEPSGAGEVAPAAQWAADGKRAMHARLPAGQSFRLTTPCIPFFGDNLPFTLACSARATGGPVNLQVVLHSADMIGQAEPLLRLDLKPDEQLQRYAATGNVLCSYVGAYWLEIVGTAEQDGEVWFDAVSLSPKGEAFEPAAPLEAALSTGALANVFAPDTLSGLKFRPTVKLTVQVANAGPARAESFRLEVRDYRERLACTVPLKLALKPGVTTTEVTVPLKELGAFRGDLCAGDGKAPLCSLVFSQIPLPRAVPPAQSNIGGHFSTASDWQMQIARRLGYKWTRIHDCSSITHWRTAEPQPGQWRFFDEDVARVRKAGLEILGEFLRVPDWATTAEPGSAAFRAGVGPYRDVVAFENYVRTVVSHYRTDIRVWEIWNEPYGGGFYGGTAEQYAALAQAAAGAAKAADPTCRLLAPCTFPSATQWTDRVLAAGGLTGADIFSYHGYGCLTKKPYGNVNAWAVRDGKPMPRWNSETGVTADTFYRHICNKLDNEYSRWAGRTPVEEAVIQSLKLFVLALASGADKYFYYWTNVEQGMAPRMNSMSIYEYDRSLRPHGVVYAIAAWLLDPSVGAGVQEYPCGVTACYLQHGKDAVVVLWRTGADGGYPLDPRALPRGARALDTMGNGLPLGSSGDRLTLDRHPVYLVVPNMSAAKLGGRLGEIINANSQ
ncbi:hypothetical protein LLH23_00470 [bacterium]|nr:hypothetical protein [bacterium]